MDRFMRTGLLLGEEGLAKLKNSRVAVFGVGGVGGYTVEALARSGIGALDLIDKDVVDITNINRQIIATEESVGRNKVDVAKERVMSINPECNVRVYKTFYLPETADEFDFGEYDYIVDAVDTVTAKLTLIENASRAKVPVISSMGAGNKLDPTGFMVSDIYKTSVCPLAKVMRRELRKRGIDSLKVVYSKEEPIKPQRQYLPESKEEAADAKNDVQEQERREKAVPGSVAFVPSVVGLIIAGEVVKDICNGGLS